MVILMIMAQKSCVSAPITTLRTASGGGALSSFSHLRSCDNFHQFGDFSSLIGLVAGRNSM